MKNQDYVLSDFRADAAKYDPAFYSTTTKFGGVSIWLSVRGNVGWYRPAMEAGKLVGLRSLALPIADDGEAPETKKILDYEFNYLGSAQIRRIEEALSE